MKRLMSWTTVAMVVTACGGGMSYGTSSGANTPSAANSAPNATPTSLPNNAAAGFVIAIQNMGFTPLNLSVPAGATVSAVNLDGMEHSVTSEPSPGSYTRGAPNGLAAFDTGAFSSGRRTFTVPANAPPGTVIPYFCTVHTNTMTTPNGTITIDPNARPNVSTPTMAPMPAPTSAPSSTTTTPSTTAPAPMPAPMPSPAPGMGGY